MSLGNFPARSEASTPPPPFSVLPSLPRPRERGPEVGLLHAKEGAGSQGTRRGAPDRFHAARPERCCALSDYPVSLCVQPVYREPKLSPGVSDTAVIGLKIISHVRRGSFHLWELAGLI